MSLRVGEALVLQVKPFGERDALVDLLCAERGRIRGLVKGGRSAKGTMAAALQGFNTVRYEQYRRLEGQLGSLTLELAVSRAKVWLGGGAGGYMVPYLSEVLGFILPEEHAYDGLSERVLAVLESGREWRDVAAFELYLLDLAGYGLRLRPEEAVECGVGSELAFVSPASGRAVPRGVAKGWEERLLELPACMGGPACDERADLARSWRLTGYFIAKALQGRELPARERLGGYFERAIRASMGDGAVAA